MGRRLRMSDLFFSQEELVADRAKRHTKFGGYGITRHSVAKWLYWSRTMRPDDGIKKLYGEAVWDIFLDLYIAEAEAKRISVTSMCIGSGVAPTTALRYMTMLIGAGWLVREEDEVDNRRVYVKLSRSGKAQMDAYLDTVMERLWSLLPQALVETAGSEVAQLKAVINELLEELRLARRQQS
jgi:DNA-binding MarR family transcriptional regulator